MPYTVKKAPDGDLSLGNLRAEIVTLQPAVSDYATGGYLLQGISGATENTGNVGISKIIGVVALSSLGGYTANWNPATNKLQVYQTGAAFATPELQVPAGTDLSALSIVLLVIGL